MPWRVIEGWCASRPPSQAPALPEAVVKAYAAVLVALDEPVVATTLVLCFYGVLRVSEALRLSPADVYVADSVITLYLAQTKRGMEETVILEDASVLRGMRWYVATGSHKRKPAARLQDLRCHVEVTTQDPWPIKPVDYIGHDFKQVEVTG